MSLHDRSSAGERWKAALLKLPDQVFFDIMRNYLGELHTPFNKHTLIDELTSFLKNGETQARLLRRIDETDVQVLTAVHVLDYPSLSLLFSFFDGSMTYLELHYLLLNLQERLLLFVDAIGGSQRVFLNPFLEQLLLREVVDSESLFPSHSYVATDAPVLWPPDTLLLALYSFLATTPDLLKADGRLKKRALEEIGAVFPQLRSEETGRIQLIFSALFRLGLLANENGVVRPEHARWEAFCKPDARARRVYLWTALVHSICARHASSGIVETPSDGPSEHLQRDAEALGSFLANLPPEKAFPRSALLRLFAVFFLGGDSSEDQPRHRADEIVSSLAELGILVLAEVGRERDDTATEEWYALNPHVGRKSEEERRLVVVEPSFQLTVKPSVDFPDGFAMASIAEIRRFDVYPRYEITKRSFVRALEQDRSAEEIIAQLERLGESRLPQNIRFSLHAWEKEYRGLAFFRGIILTADTERRHLIEHSDAMKPWIRKTLAPGVYLLDENETVEWSRALHRSGIDPIPPVRPAASKRATDRRSTDFRPVGRARLLPRAAASHRKQDTEQLRAAGEELAAELTDALASLDLPPELSSQLAARINKKLILFPQQLERVKTTVEKNEAKGLDYIGKVRLVEQALKSKSDLLEVLERTAKGETRRLLVRPTDVRKSGNDLMLHARTLPENREVQIRIRKIGLVRKLKSSLYAP